MLKKSFLLCKSLLNTTFVVLSSIVTILSFAMLSSCNSLDLETDPDDPDNQDKFEGVWVRQVQSSGDRTDLAIGGIANEPSNRVYMCEKKGSATPSFFKGYISGNTITFDDSWLPTYNVRIEDGNLILKGNLSSSLETPYKKGTWGGECGPLDGQETRIVFAYDPNQISNPTMVFHDIKFANKSVGIHVGVNNLDCEGTGSYEVPSTPDNGDFYSAILIYSYETLDGRQTFNDKIAISKYDIQPGCNKFKMDNSATGRFYAVKLP